MMYNPFVIEKRRILPVVDHFVAFLPCILLGVFRYGTNTAVNLGAAVISAFAASAVVSLVRKKSVSFYSAAAGLCASLCVPYGTDPVKTALVVFLLSLLLSATAIQGYSKPVRQIPIMCFAVALIFGADTPGMLISADIISEKTTVRTLLLGGSADSLPCLSSALSTVFAAVYLSFRRRIRLSVSLFSLVALIAAASVLFTAGDINQLTYISFLVFDGAVLFPVLIFAGSESIGGGAGFVSAALFSASGVFLMKIGINCGMYLSFALLSITDTFADAAVFGLKNTLSRVMKRTEKKEKAKKAVSRDDKENDCGKTD